MNKEFMRETFHGTRKGWLAVCLAVGVLTLLIWGNSLRTSTQSAQQSGSVLAVLAPWLDALGIQPEAFHNILRKLAHFSEYGLLGLLWTAELWLGPHHRKGRGSVERLGLCMLTALVDETIQLFMPGRSGEIRDVWIDSAGALTGILTATCVIQIGKICLSKRKIHG